MYKCAEHVQACAEHVQLVISTHERSGNQKIECTLEETEIVVLFDEPDVLNLYKHVPELKVTFVHVLNLYMFSTRLWIYGFMDSRTV